MPAPDYAWGLAPIRALDALVDVLEAVRLLVPGPVVPAVKTAHKHPHVPHARVHAVLRVRQHVEELVAAAVVNPAVKIHVPAVAKIDARHPVTMVVQTLALERVRYHVLVDAKEPAPVPVRVAQMPVPETVRQLALLVAQKDAAHVAMDVMAVVVLIAVPEAVEMYVKAHVE